MTNPLYSVGQDVAVMTPDLMDVFPKTSIIERKWVPADSIVVTVDGGNRKTIFSKTEKWVYCVAADPAYWYAEKCLRPINPNTEYLEDEITINISEKTQ